MRRSLALGWLLFATAFVFSVVLAPAVQAATIHPNETVDVTYIGTGCRRDAPDTDHCTLRDAIAAAQPGDTVSLESPAPAGPYTISQDELLIQKNITIRGRGARSTTVSGAGCATAAPPCRVFRIDTALVTLAGITVADGKATGSCAASNPPSPCAEGAGILVNGPTQFDPSRGLTLIDSTVRGNSAVGTTMGTVHGQGTGGGIAAFNGTLTIVNSTITGNQATCTGSCPGGGGAGIQVDFETVSITNSTIAGNVAGDSTHQGFGGGIDSGQTRQTLRSTTISGNTAAGPAGTGGNIKTNPGDRYNFKNSIVANGTAAVGPSCTLDPTMMPAARITSSGYNIDSLDQCSFHAAGDLPKTNPQLGPLADNGGQTDTLALSAASPAVDAASPDCPPPIADQRGLLRPQGIACDIGAFERAQSSGGGPGPGGGGAPATPALTALKIKPSVFPAGANGGSIARRRARRTGTTISYRDSRVGTAMFTVLRPAKGIRDKRRRCVVPKKGRRGARCTRYLSVGTFTHVDRAGANSFHFTGRVRRRKLSPGSYRLQAVPRANGRNGKAVTVSFRIVK